MESKRDRFLGVVIKPERIRIEKKKVEGSIGLASP